MDGAVGTEVRPEVVAGHPPWQVGDIDGLRSIGVTDLCPDTGAATTIRTGRRLLLLLEHGVELESLRHRVHLTTVSLDDERDDFPTSAGTSGTTGTMEIVLGVAGGVVVDDGSDGLDMDAPGCNVGGDQSRGSPRRESLECLRSLLLGASSVKSHGGDSELSELLG